MRKTLLVCAAAAGFFGCSQPRESVPMRAKRLIDQVPATSAPYEAKELDALRSDGHIAAHIVLKGEGRPALAPVSPSRLSFALELPEQPRLRFAIASVPSGAGDSAVESEFRVVLHTPEGTESVFREVVPRRRSGRWLEREVDLSGWSGERVELALETKSRGEVAAPGEVFAIWGDPVVASRLRTPGVDLILVSIDCLRADHMGIYGYSRPTTPNLDRFAADAVVFDGAVASAPWTVPSHYTMLTGLPPSFHGVAAHQNAIWNGTAKLLPPGVSFLPEVLARAGYDTHAVVTSSPVSADYGFHRGFGTFRELSPDASKAVDAAVRTLARAPEREQFLFLHLIDPHAPYQPKVEFREYSKTFIERFGPRLEDISDLVDMVEARIPPRRPEDVAGVVQLYDATIAYVDEHLGRFFEELESLEILDNAVVVVTGDHGEAFYDHGYWQHGTTLFQDLVHIPLLVRWPEVAPARVSVPASLADIVPTFVQAAGLSPMPSEGEDLKVLLDRGRRSNALGSASEVNLLLPEGTRTLVSFRLADVKYVATLEGAFDAIGPDPILSEALYDLTSDPGEERALPLEDEAELLGEFRELLRAYLDKGARLREVWGEGEPATPDDETREKLRALGYVQ